MSNFIEKLIVFNKIRAKKQIEISFKKFVESAHKKFDSKYDYSNVNYKHKRVKVKIVCPVHGLFEQMPESHLKSGCLRCQKEEKIKTKTNKFIEKANKIHKGKYDYSLVDSVINKYEIKIICPEHGEFIQNPKYHLIGSGCGKCSLTEKINEYVEQSNKVHENKYDYSLVKLEDFPYAEIICPNHGKFRQALHYHSIGRLCPKCSKTISKFENDIFEFIKNNYNGEIITRNRTKINLELDIFLPEINLAFEYNGLFWHCEINKDDNYHFTKTELCEKKGIHLVHIYEDDWTFKRNIVKSRILSLLGKNERIFARNCIVKNVSSKIKKVFLENNHLQGNVNSKINLGLFLDDELIGLMSFGRLRKSLGLRDESNSFELLRFCNKNGMSVIGGAGKLFNFFLKNYNPKNIISYADRSWTNSNKDNLYKKLNFKSFWF